MLSLGPRRLLACTLTFLFLLLPLLSAAQTPIPAGSSYELGFSPGRSSLAVVLKAIGSARRDLLIACYEFTSRDIAQAVEDAAHRGVKVRIVADWKAASDRYSQIRILIAAGIPVRLDQRYAILHHKFMVVDGLSVETGSFNYTGSAIERNAENSLVLWNVPSLAEAYAREWERLWEESKPGSATGTR
ncbi:MAG TPA: phospholipase D family protein [Rectinemataceae bacterium]|nr:phospholipase D family protein [Rectinemataceae bacterium]